MGIDPAIGTPSSILTTNLNDRATATTMTRPLAHIVKMRVERGLVDQDMPTALYHFYRCYRATLRARLAIAHLSEPKPRTPEKWPRLARAYLAIAARDAARLEALVRTPRGRSGRGRREAA